MVRERVAGDPLHLDRARHLLAGRGDRRNPAEPRVHHRHRRRAGVLRASRDRSPRIAMGRFRQFCSNVAAVTYKEATIISHDRAFLSAVFIQPWIMFLVFGAVVSNDPVNVPWGVFDQSQSALSRRLVQEIQASGYFLPPVRASSYDSARERLRAGELLAVLVIPPSLARDAERGTPRVQLLLDGSDPLSAARVGAYVSRIAAAVEPRLSAPTAFDADATVR